MDEHDVPDGPDATVVERHRAQLRAAMEGLVPLDEARRRRPRTGLAIGAVAAAAAAIVAAAVLVDGPASTTTEVAGPGEPESTTTTSLAPVATPASTCGDAPPFDLALPEGFDGPTVGAPGPDGELVARWTLVGGATTVELWWPSPRPRHVESTPTVEGAVGSVTGGPGDDLVTIQVYAASLGEGPCAVADVVVDGDTDATTLPVASQVWVGLFESRGAPFGPAPIPLVANRGAADAAPEVPPCDAPAGVEHDDFQGGDLAGFPAAGTAADALQAVVDGTTVEAEDPLGFQYRMRILPRGGYDELTLPDGTVAFVADVGQGRTVVTVAPTPDGTWTPVRWLATGC